MVDGAWDGRAIARKRVSLVELAQRGHPGTTRK